MKVVIVFESMYGNTRPIAEAIGSGFNDWDDVRVEPVAAVAPASLRADLLIVGGRTKFHGLATPATWRAAARAAGKDPTLVVDPTTCDAPLHEWLEALPLARSRAAAFDTRLDAPVLLTGHSSASIAKRLKQRGYHVIVEPESFLVDHESSLINGELERARRWGEALSAEMHTAPDTETMAGMVTVPAGD